jgi:hypothetical protein
MTIPIPTTTNEPELAGTMEGQRIVARMRLHESNEMFTAIRSALPAKIVEAKAEVEKIYLDHENKVMQWCGRYWLAVYAEIETYFASATRKAYQ